MTGRPRAFSCICTMTVSMRYLMENGFFSKLTWSERILEKSRTSFMRVCRTLAESVMCLISPSCCSLVSVWERRSSMPRIACIGVLISWLMIARKSDFIRFALVSASTTAFMRLWYSTSPVTSVAVP